MKTLPVSPGPCGLEPALPLSVRPAGISDAAAIAALCSESMGYPAPEQEVRGRLQALLQDGAQCILVAEAGGETIGYIHACDYQVLYAPAMKNILGLAVSPAFRRRGAASALLAAVEDWARQTGAEAIRLVSGESRTGAHAFYRSQGYTGEKRQLNFKKPVG